MTPLISYFVYRALSQWAASADSLTVGFMSEFMEPVVAGSIGRVVAGMAQGSGPLGKVASLVVGAGYLAYQEYADVQPDHIFANYALGASYISGDPSWFVEKPYYGALGTAVALGLCAGGYYASTAAQVASNRLFAQIEQRHSNTLLK